MLPQFGDCNASPGARGATATTVLGTAWSRDMLTARIPKRRIKPTRAGLLGCGHSDRSRSRSSTALRASFSRRCFSAARSTMVPHCAQVTGVLGSGVAVAALKRVLPHCGHLRENLICVMCEIACQAAPRLKGEQLRSRVHPLLYELTLHQPPPGPRTRHHSIALGLPLRFPFPVSPFPRFRVFPFPAFVSHPRAPKPSPTALTRRQLRHLFELHQLHPLKHELRDPRPARHHHRLFAQVDHWDH